MIYHRPTVSVAPNTRSDSSPSGFWLLDSQFFLFSQTRTLFSSFILHPSSFILIILPLALFIFTPPITRAQTNDQADLSPGNDQPSPIDQPSRFDNLQAGPDLSKLKITQPKIVLPEGYPISGRRAKLVKLPDDHRWFLIFDEARQILMPQPDQNSSKISKTNSKSPLSPSKTVENQKKLNQNANISEKNLSPEPSKHNSKPQDPFSHPMEVLPGKWLAAMNKVMGNRMDLTVDFRIWGEVTTYHNRNYILPTFVATLLQFGKNAADNTKSSTKINPLETTFGPPKSAGTQNTKQTQFLDKTMIPKKLRDAIMSIPRTQPLELDDLKQTYTRPKPAVAIPITSDEKKTSQQNNWRDGYMIIDRVGRIHYDPEGMRWLFTFEADGASLAEPPVALHPCRLLEVMETSARQSAVSIRFRISGQISQYQGRNYMLLRKVLMVYELGNLIK